MRKLIIITHKTFADGLKDSLVFFTNMEDQITAIPAYENGVNEFPKKELEKVLSKTKKEDQVFILTDLLGGSVNQNAVKYKDDNIFIITGVNLPVALEIMLDHKNILNHSDIEQIINSSASQLIFMNSYIDNHSEFDE